MSQVKTSGLDMAKLRSFKTVVEEESFSRASRKLLRTQPAVSLAIKKLEDQVGHRLLERTRPKPLLTDAGRVVFEYAQRFELERRKLVDELDELDNLVAGRLSIGANESSTLYLMRHLKSFRRLYPKIGVRVQHTISSEIPNQIVQGKLELGVISYASNEARLASKVIYTDHLAFIVAPQHRLAKKDSVSIKELGGESFIAHNVVSPYRGAVLEVFTRHRVPLNMEIEMPTVETIRRLVQSNEGVAFLPRMCVDQEIRQGTLCEVRVEEIFVQRPIHLIYPENRTLSQASKAFLELVGDS